MGLLDDAIREHLDLKRRRGADPTEIERAEREALGPVRRGPETAEPDEYSAEPGTGAVTEYEEEPEWAEPAGEEPPSGIYDETIEGHDADEPGAAYEQPTPLYESPVDSDPLLDRDPNAFDAPLPRDEPEAYTHPLGPDEPEPRRPGLESDPLDDLEPDPASPAPHAAPASPQPRSGETIEYSVEDEVNPSDDDVLEETPEFLQDAPEHDRLWFEQRPPRDFDFNE
jgi:hypothetical protein